MDEAEEVLEYMMFPSGDKAAEVVQGEQPDRRNRDEGYVEKDLSTGDVWGRDVYSG